MKKLSHFSLLLFIAGVFSMIICSESDYCWREYEGTIPADALTVGSDKSGSPIYIAQVLFHDKLVPGRIHHNGKKVYFEFFDLENPKNLNTKILCTQQPQKFEWLPSENGKINKLDHKVLIKGGHENTTPTYIGKIAKNGEISIGKVMCQKNNCGRLYTSNSGSYKEHGVFEILSYNPQIESVGVNCDPAIDIRMGGSK